MISACARCCRIKSHISRISVIRHHLCSENWKMSKKDYTAGIIVIGDEILKGQVLDTNTHFLTKHLFSWGVKVKKISVVSDVLECIANEVKEFSSNYTFVITTGGIGPTHDDLTFESVGLAFNDPIEPHPHLVELCKKYFGTDDLNSPKLKMAKVPKSAKLIYGEDKSTGKKTKYPVVNVRNVYLFPGVPSILEHAFPLLKDQFKNPDMEFYTKELYIQHDEMSITPILNEADTKFRQHVTLGSYPDFINSYYKVKLTLESESNERLQEAVTFLEQHLPQDSIVQYEKNPVANAVNQVYGVVCGQDTSRYATKVRKAVSILEEALERYKLEEVCVGFNGGKDCTVLLHLVYAVVKKNEQFHNVVDV